MQIWFVISLIFSAAITIFAVLNADVVTIRLFWVNYDLSQSLVILMSAASGAIITIFLGIFSKIKSSLKIRELNNELESANKKIALLSNSHNMNEQKSAQVVEQKAESVDTSRTE